MKVRIVKASERHLKDFVRIGRQHWSYEWVTPDYFRNTLKSRGFHFAALDGRKVVGGLMIVEEDYPRFSCYYLAVDKNYLRRGIASSMFEEAESKMEKGVFIFVDTSKFEKDAIEFYRKVGFKEMGRVRNWFERGIEGIFMAKKV